MVVHIPVNGAPARLTDCTVIVAVPGEAVVVLDIVVDVVVEVAPQLRTATRLVVLVIVMSLRPFVFPLSCQWSNWHEP